MLWAMLSHALRQGTCYMLLHVSITITLFINASKVWW